jgi:hypothetical protein
MKRVFGNSRGLGDLAKHNYLSSISSEQHLDFFLEIMETGRDSFSESTLRHLSGGVDFL